MTARYYPEIFSGVVDEDDAKRVILTSEGPDADTATRWAVETPYVLELANNALSLRPGMVVLDYGCGIGRVAKAMIAIDVLGWSQTIVAAPRSRSPHPPAGQPPAEYQTGLAGPE